MTDIYVRRATLRNEGSPVDCLVPVAEHDHELLTKIPKDKSVRAKITRPRSTRQHRLYWGLCREVLNNIDHEDFRTERNVSDYILLKIGHYEMVEFGGNLLATPASISFSKCDQAKFNPLIERAIDLICSDEKLLRGTDPQDLTAKIYNDLSVS